MSNYNQSKNHQHPVLKQNLSLKKPPTKQEKIGKNKEEKKHLKAVSPIV